ncbi:hypothetical protein CPT_Phriendly_062 [Vibrio phage Phriendly]|nr:hypothetical protein CPT_Phriendly_062 [Vibrio phage Phriendly]
MSIAEYEATEKESHPNARVNIASGEVVISCNDGTGTHTHAEAMAHIEANWPSEDIEEV